MINKKKKNWQSKKHNYTMEKSDSTAKCLVACSEKKRKLKVAANGYGFFKGKKGREGRQGILDSKESCLFN